ncbi:MAG: hypothetical protein LQ350_006683 [Teloschistes chrysophthalmus]|nr:MAG: hypothetical protein LQ350_006683 [Niorma chrysophthalma]
MSSLLSPRICLQLLRSPSRSTQTPFRPISHWHIRPTPRSKESLLPLSQLTQPQRRHKSFYRGARELYRDHPISVIFATFCIVSASGLFFYANHVYQNYIISEFSSYPEPVANKLRRALWYSNHDLQPDNALKYYKQALEVAQECGMDAFSDEILGVKFQLASFLEKQMTKPKLAIDVLEEVKKQCTQWQVEKGGLVENRGLRTSVLRQCLRVSVKLGELYARPDIMETEAAEESLVWAVTTLLKEQERREREGVKEGEGEWMSAEEIGGALESTHYSSHSQHYLATPLYLQATRLTPPTSCHLPVLMNNLAASLLTQRTPTTPYDPPTDPAALLDSAYAWGLRAFQTGKHIRTNPPPPPTTTDTNNNKNKTAKVDTSECDRACVTALYNLGEIAEIRDDLQDAQERYMHSGRIAQGIGWVEGVERTSARLRVVNSRLRIRAPTEYRRYTDSF